MDDRTAFYKSARWKTLRAQVLRRDRYMCQLSRRTGKMRQAQTVHHIFPREFYPEYQWEPWNLISLTNEAHNSLHDRDTHELTASGRELLRRICRREGIEVPARYKA